MEPYEQLKHEIFSRCYKALKKYLEVDNRYKSSVHPFAAYPQLRYAGGYFSALYELIEEYGLEDEYYKWQEENVKEDE